MPHWLLCFVSQVDTWLPVRYIAWCKVVAPDIDLRVLLADLASLTLVHLQIVKPQRCIANLTHTVFASITLFLSSALIFLFTSNTIALAFALLHSIDHLVGDACFLPLCIHSCVT